MSGKLMKTKMCLSKFIAIGSVLLCFGVTGAGAQDTTAASIDSPVVRADVERAKLIAGSNADLQQTLTLCLNPQAYRTWLTTLPNAKKVAQFRVFDQLYYLGMKDVGSWVLVTSDGIIQ